MSTPDDDHSPKEALLTQPSPPPPAASSESLIVLADKGFPHSSNVRCELLPSTSPPEGDLCRICLLTTNSRRKPLVAPCRCSGTMKHIHLNCLAHWIEVSSRKMSPSPRCELCGFSYRRRPFVDITRLRLPHMDCCDSVLNLLFLLLVLIMVLCGWVAIYYLKATEGRPSRKANRHPNRIVISEDDVAVIIAMALFFAAFFLALFTQHRAEVTVLKLFERAWTTNRNWRIRDYSTKDELAGVEEKAVRSAHKV